MTLTKPTIHFDKRRSEDELYDALRREVTTLRRLADSDSESGNDVGVILQPSLSSLHKIDCFLRETQKLRDVLEVESGRVQRELAAYLSRRVERTPR